MGQKRKYSLILENRSKLAGVFSWNLSRAGIWGLVAALFLCPFLLGILLMALTPLGNFLPSGRSSEDDIRAEMALARIDSLQKRLEIDRLYMENIHHIMDPDANHNVDSVSSAAVTVSPASIIPVSRRERNFVKKISTRERSAGRLLASDPARNLAFTPPLDGSPMDKNSRNTGVARFRVPVNADIYAIADGRVVEKYYSSSGFVLIVQHPKGYISRYTFNGSPLVDVGDWVSAGQSMSVPSRYASPGLLLLELWHDGDRLMPEDFLDSYFFSSSI